MPGQDPKWDYGFWDVAKWDLVHGVFERKKKDPYIDFINTFYRQHKVPLTVLTEYLMSKKDIT